MAPGDPALVMACESRRRLFSFSGSLREKFGLDQPLPVQLFSLCQRHSQPRSRLPFRQQMRPNADPAAPAGDAVAGPGRRIRDFAGLGNLLSAPWRPRVFFFAGTWPIPDHTVGWRLIF